MNEQQQADVRRWLACIAADVIDQFVGKANRIEAPTGMPHDRDASFDRSDPWGLRTEWQAIQPVFDGLSPLHQEVLSLRLEHGLAYTEIAERLAVPVGTVHSRLARARRAAGWKGAGGPAFATTVAAHAGVSDAEPNDLPPPAREPLPPAAA